MKGSFQVEFSSCSFFTLFPSFTFLTFRNQPALLKKSLTRAETFRPTKPARKLRVTQIAVNIESTIPKASMSAKPFTIEVPNQ